MNPNQLQALANQAQQYLQSNQLGEAKDCYLKVSKHAKNNPGIWMTLGVLDGKLGHFKSACEFFNKAIQLAPDQAEGYLNLAKSQSAMGLFELSEKNYKKSLSIDPNLIEAWMNLANIQGKQKHYTAAIESFHQVLSRNNIAAAHFGMAACQQALLEYGAAEQSYQAALQLQTIYPEAHNSLGVMFQEQGRLEDAVAHYSLATEQNENYAIAHYNLGIAQHEMGCYTDASRAFHRSIAINPQFVEAYVALGRTAGISGTLKESIFCYQKALEINPENVEAMINLAQARALQGEFEQALELYRRSADLAPDQLEAITGQVHVLERRGLFVDATTMLQPLLDAGIQDPNVAIAFATLARRTDRHDEAKELLENVFQVDAPKFSGLQRSVMHFSLGTLYQDQELYELAFQQFQKANHLLPYHFSIKDHRSYINQIIQHCSRKNLDSSPRSRLNTSRPIFIVGMPRSGTSLIEQIIASHPQVFGAGELSLISECSRNMQQSINSTLPFPANINELTQDSVDKLSQHYLSQLDEINSEAKCVTDKMPHNFMDLALIELILPQAKVIHCRRNPMDTCLSIYNQRFSANHPYSTELDHLGLYYREYDRLMEHWHNNLEIPIFEIQYEDLVNDQVSMTRKLIEFCGLDWNEACVNFHKSGREVVTPSYDQVRQPIYKGAIDRWRHYENNLQPLQDALNYK